ncbi:hypothetical protein [Tautonia plasticadhaerens]|uniref:Uncharacterized protein n=1 Tax=Tautonia plasticadhaerens TaxID=2527974 RepID=A0A518H7G5_9BACT|nr:hypothetical protein [Tautonia plasticadhaerens]QDV36782.1 hypothetical protein ElP_47110 [Tautonia plasticadhaerens]
MTLVDRIGRSAFVGLAVGLGWGIRGDFGHNVGAMYPGAALGLAFCYVGGQRSLFSWMPVLAALSALAIGSGGTMSYGILHGYAQSDTFVNYGYGFLTLFFQGAAWGTFGGALIGLMLERRPMSTSDWLGLAGSIFIGGWLIGFAMIRLLGFQINPPRNNSSIVFMGAAIGQLVWLACNRRPVGLRGGLLGYVGFGLGMAGGRLLGNLANVMQGEFGFTINHWNVMEVSCGLIGGFVFTFGMVDRPYPEPPKERNFTLSSAYGILFVLGLIPLWHRVARVVPGEKLRSWTEALRSSGHPDPELWAQTILPMIDAACLFGFVGAAVWLAAHLKGRSRWAPLPILWLSGTMLLFQNLNALYFFTPGKAEHVDMHLVFWVIFGLMILYVAFADPRPAALPDTAGGDEHRGRFVAWGLATLAAFALILVLAGWINGEVTMRSANTRWPEWSWRDGPFPGR